MSLKLFLQNVLADTNFVPPKLSLRKNSAKLLHRLNLGGTNFVSVDTSCRTIFRLIGIKKIVIEKNEISLPQVSHNLLTLSSNLVRLESLQLARQVPQRQTESLQQDYLSSFQMIEFLDLPWLSYKTLSGIGQKNKGQGRL
ncbi:hypothetical protein BpHYR1_012048 [Brachionus plicatilis]|uniref:Uncharacterized protein n=1 Tax=Brachionus plicatilis TaxID=10195 RepID=A0A3M7SVN6_BRAPC|nr:hypothetical protein BpHYR1_012048 [Brachionus plicatilis]